jgi:hypothetical protein
MDDDNLRGGEIVAIDDCLVLLEIEDSLGDLFEMLNHLEGTSYFQTIRLRQLLIITAEEIENVIVREGRL